MLARLDESFRRERQFTADASHELRTPLAAMQAILTVVRQEQRTPEDYETALADLAEETGRLQSLTEDLLHLARGDMRSLQVKEPVDLTALLCDVSDSLRPLAELKGLALSADIQPGLLMTGDSDRLISLFVNLVDNAIKFTESGEIRVYANLDGNDYILVSVKDTGSGIPAEQIDHVFDRFFRLDASRSSPGAGLGLAIAQEIAIAHGGNITVNSQVGKGSTFLVRLSL